MATNPKRPRDPNQLAKSIVDLATGETTPTPEPVKTPEQQAAALIGRKGGLKGGRARAEKMSPEQRSAIAKKAAAARWK